MTMVPTITDTRSPIAFIDLGAQRRRLGTRLESVVKRVIDHGQYIMGPEVTKLEEELAAFCTVKHCVSCASGTDALALALMAKGIRPGDAIFVPAFTFVATAEVVAWFGAIPVFVDVEGETFNMDPLSLKAGIAVAIEKRLIPRGVIPVDLFGHPADYRRIVPIAAEHGLFVLADAAQSFGATIDNRRVGSFGEITATSFFPSKPLGCFGDGGGDIY